MGLEIRESNRRIWLIAGSPSQSTEFLSNISQDMTSNDLIIGVDGGFQIAMDHGWKIHAYFGDFDSIDQTVVELYVKSHNECTIHSFSQDKDSSDLELALDYALQIPESTITIINATGGRSDHAIFNYLLLNRSPERIHIWDSQGTLLLLTPKICHYFSFTDPTVFSLIPFEKSKKVKIKNAKYLLDSEDLEFSTRSLSNISLKNKELSIYYETGLLALYLVNRFI